MTGLDRIGIPVYMAIRPNSRGLAVSQGKGVNEIDAKVSAAAESIEAWHAERPGMPVVLERYDDLRDQATVAEVGRLPVARNSCFSGTARLPWTQGTDVCSGETVWVPFELVHADATLPRMPGSGAFVFSTNGLASGNTREEALQHGICELIERDAMALWKAGGEEQQGRTRVLLGSIDDEVCKTLIQQFLACGIVPMVWNVTSDIGVAAFRVLIFDQWSQSTNTPYPTAFGAGCHPDAGVALRRALTEAAQSRLTVIAGSRDDGTRRRYNAAQAEEAANYHRLLSRVQGEAQFNAVRSQQPASVEASLEAVISHLDGAGFRQILAVDLTRDDSPLCVQRCIIPGLEGPSSSPSYAGGARLKSLVQ